MNNDCQSPPQHTCAVTAARAVAQTAAGHLNGVRVSIDDPLAHKHGGREIREHQRVRSGGKHPLPLLIKAKGVKGTAARSSEGREGAEDDSKRVRRYYDNEVRGLRHDEGGGR